MVKVSEKHVASLAVSRFGADGPRVKQALQSVLQAHSQGRDADLLEVLVAERLLGCVRAEDTVARLGGDEFAMLLDNPNDAERIATRVVEQMRRPFFLNGHEVRATMSVGVTRSLNIVTTAAEYEQAIETRMAGRLRTQRLAQRPNFVNTREAAEAGTLYGTPDEVSAKLQTLRDMGAEYVLLNSAGGIASLRRFAHEVMPAFTSEPVLQTAV